MAGERGLIICLPYLVLRAITDGSKTKNECKLLLYDYVVKSKVLPIAAVRGARALDLWAYVHVDAKAVPTRYRTPTHGPDSLHTKIFMYSMM